MTSSIRIHDIIDAAGSQFVSVQFTKKDGTPRQITFNPADHQDIKGTGTPTTNPDIFRIREASKGQWRSFDANRVQTIKVAGRIHTFN